MARVIFGRLLALVAFGIAVFLAAAWVTQDRPTAWLGRIAGDGARPAEVGGVRHHAAKRGLPQSVIPVGVPSVVGAP